MSEVLHLRIGDDDTMKVSLGIFLGTLECIRAEFPEQTELTEENREQFRDRMVLMAGNNKLPMEGVDFIANFCTLTNWPIR